MVYPKICHQPLNISCPIKDVGTFSPDKKIDCLMLILKEEDRLKLEFSDEREKTWIEEYPEDFMYRVPNYALVFIQGHSNPLVPVMFD